MCVAFLVRGLFCDKKGQGLNVKHGNLQSFKVERDKEPDLFCFYLLFWETAHGYECLKKKKQLLVVLLILIILFGSDNLHHSQCK